MPDDSGARESENLDLLLLAAAALGAVLVLARQAAYGVGLPSASVDLIAAARSILAGAGFRNYAGYVSVGSPPLYPLLLAVVSADVLDPLDVAGPVNAALFGLTIFVVGQYLRRRLESRFLVVWAAFAIALAWPLAGLAAYALTGATFILLVTLTLINTDAFLAKGRTSSLVWTGICAALAWQTQYLGGALAAAVAVMLLAQRGARPARRVRRAAGFALLAGAPMAVWLVRNWSVSGRFTDARGRGSLSWPETLSDAGEVLRSWATFDLPLIEWQAVAWLGLLPAAALAAACGVLIGKRWRTRPSPSGWMPQSGWLPCYVFGGFAVAYFLALTVSLALGATGYDVKPRYVAPLYVPLLLTAAFALDRVHGRAAPRAAAAVVTAVLCIWIAGQIEPHAREIRRANTEGMDGYANSWWAPSETRDWLRRNPLPGRTISNEPLAVYVHNDASADLSARYGHLPRAEEQLQRWLVEVRSGTWIVWFDNVYVNRTYDYGRAALRAASVLEPVAELADGAVFRAGPADGDGAPADE